MGFTLGLNEPQPEEGMAAHSSMLAWKLLWTEGHGGLQPPWGCKELGTTEVPWQAQPQSRHDPLAISTQCLVFMRLPDLAGGSGNSSQPYEL